MAPGLVQMRAAPVLPAGDSEEQPCRRRRGLGLRFPSSARLAQRAQHPGLAAGRMCCPVSQARQKQGSGTGSGLVSAASPRLSWRGGIDGDRPAASGRPPWTHPAVLVPGRAMQRIGRLGVHGASASSQSWGLCSAAVPLPRASGQGLDDGQSGLAAHGRTWHAEGGLGRGVGGGAGEAAGCSRGAVGKPILEGSPVWWHLHRSPCPHNAGELRHRVLCPGALQESTGASWAPVCNQRSTGRGRAWV